MELKARRPLTREEEAVKLLLIFRFRLFEVCERLYEDHYYI